MEARELRPDPRVERQESGRLPFFDGLVVRTDERQFPNNKFPIVLSRNMDGVDYNVGLLTIHKDSVYVLGYTFDSERAMLLRISRDGTTRITFPELSDIVDMETFEAMQAEDPNLIHTPIDALIYDGSGEGKYGLRDSHIMFDELLEEESDVADDVREDLREELDTLLRITQLSLTRDKLLASKRLRNVKRGQETLLEWAEGEARGEFVNVETGTLLRAFGTGDISGETTGDDLVDEGAAQYPYPDDHAWMGSGPRHRQSTVARIPDDVEQAPLFRDERGLQAFVTTARREIEAIVDTQATFKRLEQLGLDVYFGNGVHIAVDHEAPRVTFEPQSYLYKNSERNEALQHVAMQAVRIDSKTNGLLLEVSLKAGTYVFLYGPNKSLSLLYNDETITLTDGNTHEEVNALLGFLDQQMHTRLSLRRSRYEGRVVRKLHRLIRYLTK